MSTPEPIPAPLPDPPGPEEIARHRAIVADDGTSGRLRLESKLWLATHGLVELPQDEPPRPTTFVENSAIGVPAWDPPKPRGGLRLTGDGPQAREPRKARAHMRRLSDVESEEVEWLWPGRIPIGTVTLIAGDPGAGKSTLGRSITTAVTVGGCWPDQADAHAEPGSVVLLTAEENLANAVRPRLEAMGADVSKVHVLETVEYEDGRLAPFSMARDVPLLEEAVAALEDVRLIIIDPIGSYVGGTDSHNDSEVREALNPLFKLAEKHRLAVVLIAHLNKGGGSNVLYRISGSIGFSGTARMVWFYSKHPYDKGQRILSFVKGNSNCEETTQTAIACGFAHGQPIWDPEPIDWNADDVARLLQAEGEKFKTAAKKAGRKLDRTPAAMEFLLKILANGDACLFAVAAEKALLVGIAESTLRRAVKRLTDEGRISRYDVPPDVRVWLKIIPAADGKTDQPPLTGFG